jgi:hypothetical protein
MENNWFRSHPRLTTHLVAEGKVPAFTLIDVGCSGGIAAYWRTFGPALRALGIDPLNAEIARLSRAEAGPGTVVYRAASAGWREMEARVLAATGGRPAPDDRTMSRASCWAAIERLVSSDNRNCPPGDTRNGPPWG